MEKMIRAGMNVARLNFSHGDFSSHKKVIEKLRAAAQLADHRLAILADLPGPKMRIGELGTEPLELKPGDTFTLTTKEIIGDSRRVSVSFPRLPQVVKSGDTLYLNDGMIQLQVRKVEGADVTCQVMVGGELRSRKGVNLPGIDLGRSAFTDRDRECLRFALEQGVDAVSQSFVDSAADVEALRQAARELGRSPFLIAKIERSRALDQIDEILEAADGIMIARGDLGVEVPIERMAVLQKTLLRKAVRSGKPVITATQMLESMIHSRQPTRAEATDVANAILDGTDAVMLSGESATGHYPVEAVETLARIAAATEPYRSRVDVWEALKTLPRDRPYSVRDLISLSVETTLEIAPAAAVIVPTQSGATARSIARFRLPVWIAAVSSEGSTCQQLQFSYGVYPAYHPDPAEDWDAFSRQWVRSQGLAGNLAILIRGPSPAHPERNHRLEFIDLTRA
jgi:pyruvate kinase